MLYPDVDRVSPARMAKSEPVIPSVDPPLSVYLLSFNHEAQILLRALTGRSCALWLLLERIVQLVKTSIQDHSR
jgi:hypothetical protein